MLIKLGIIAGILIAGGLIFSSEINALFPSTSTSVIESLKSNVDDIGKKTSESVEKRLDISFDKIVDKTNEQINDGVVNAKESSKNITDELTKINPIDTIGNFFKKST